MMKLMFLMSLLLCVSITGIAGYSVTGKYIYDPSGAKVTIRGIDRPSFEWNAAGEQASLSDYTLMSNWGANVVRISLNQEFWFAASSYAATIDQQIAWVTQLGMGVILDLHWNGPNGGAQQNMADRNSITFWTSVATRYKNNKWIMFELYNEPHDVSWSQWLNGDSTYAGMQNMYDAVRAAGANNVVIVCGLNWAFDLSGVSNGYAVRGTNIAYATHPYDYAGKQAGDWPAAFGNLASTYPVIMTEFGQYCATNTYVADLLTYAEANGIHWTAWAWYVSGCAFPSIIADWNGTPSSIVGVLVKNLLTSKKGSTPGSSSSSGSSGATSAPTAAPTTKPTSAPTPTAAPTTRPTSAPTTATNAVSVYSDGLASGWQDWSWSTSYSLSDTAYVRTGSKAIRFELVSYQAVYFHTTTNFALGTYGQVVFYVNGGTSTKTADTASVKVYGTSGTVIGSVNFPSPITANTWTQIAIPTTSFGVAASSVITGFAIQSNAATSVGIIYIDDVSLAPSSGGNTVPPYVPTQAPTPKPTTAPTAAPTAASTPRPTTAPPAASTKPTTVPNAVPTTKPTSAPTAAPTTAPTAAPTTEPTSAPTTAPTIAPTAAPTTAPTTAPTAAPTTAPASGCDASSVRLVQTFVGSWESAGQIVSQYNVVVESTCSNKILVGMTLSASNWNTVNYWNIVVDNGGMSLPSYAYVTPSTPFSLGYQNVGGQASLSITSVNFQ